MSSINDNNVLDAVRYLNTKGILNVQTGDSAPSYTGANIGMPGGILTSVNPAMVKVLTQPRKAEQLLGGRAKLLDWAETSALTPIVEQIGRADRYSDFENPTYMAVNLKFVKKGHALLTKGINVGNRREMQMSLAKVNEEQIQVQGALESLALGMNDIAFRGDTTKGLEAPVTGLLNDPSLSSYIVSTTTKSAPTFKTIYADVNRLFGELVTQAASWVDQNTEMTLGIAANRWSYLTEVTDYSKSVMETLKANFPNMKFMAIPNFNADQTDNNKDVMYLIAQSEEVGSMKETGVIGYSEIGMASPIVQGTNSRQQQFMTGTLGAVIYKPFLIARMSFQD